MSGDAPTVGYDPADTMPGAAARMAVETYERHAKAVDRAERLWVEHLRAMARVMTPADYEWYVATTMAVDERIDAKRAERPGLYDTGVLS